MRLYQRARYRVSPEVVECVVRDFDRAEKESRHLSCKELDARLTHCNDGDYLMNRSHKHDVSHKRSRLGAQYRAYLQESKKMLPLMATYIHFPEQHHRRIHTLESGDRIFNKVRRALESQSPWTPNGVDGEIIYRAAFASALNSRWTALKVAPIVETG